MRRLVMLVAVVAAFAGIVGALAVIAPQGGHLVAVWRPPQPADRSSTSKTAATPTTGAERVTPPPLFPAERRADTDQPAPCGSYTVVRKATSAGRGLLLLDRGGHVVKTFAPASEYGSFDALWCFDVTGDGIPELMIEEYTGGAHCCFADTILSLGEQIAGAEVWSGNVGAPAPQRLDARRAVYQLVGSDDALAYFEDAQKQIVPYICASPFARVLDYRGGQYVEATPEFPTVLRADRDAARREVSDPADRDPEAATGGEDDCRLKGLGLRMLADSLLLQDWDAEKGHLGLPAGLVGWLDRNQTRVQKEMRRPRGQKEDGSRYAALVVAAPRSVASEDQVRDLGITPDALWTGIRSGCGGWAPCMNVEHFARDARCFAEGNCIDFVGGQECMGPQRTCFPRSNEDQAAGDHYLVSSGGPHGVMIDFGVTADGRVARVSASGNAEDAQLGAAMMARIASGAVPAWRELPRWMGDSYTTLAKLGGNFGEWSRSHPTPAFVEQAFQRVQAAAAAGLRPDPADLAAMRPYSDEFGSRFNTYMQTCDGSPLPAECQRTIMGHGVRVVVTRNTIVVALSIESLVGDAERSSTTASGDTAGTPK